MIPWITRNLVYRPVHLLRGEPVWQCRKDIRSFHKLGLTEMKNIQWQKVASLLNYLNEHNPYYKELFSRNKIDVGTIRTPEDFRKIPFLTKADLNRFADQMISADKRRLSRRKTSGSTGIPLKFFKDREASAYMDALMYEVYGWHGIEIGDRQARVWGVPLDLSGRMQTRLKDILLNRRRLVAFNIDQDMAAVYFKELKKFRPKFMYGLVNTMCEFAEAVISAGLNPADIGLKVIITTGEIQHQHQREYLAETFNCRLVNEYGTTESGIVAMECPKGNLHQLIHNLYLEYIDPETGAPVKPGETGEVVITELHSYTMPFLRYRVGDLVETTDRTCDCGLALPLLNKVIGRTSDLIITPDGKKVSSAILSYSMPKGISQFRTYQRNTEGIEVLLKSEKNLPDEELKQIEKKLRSHLGNELKIEIHRVETIPKDPSGKFRHFITELKQHDL